MKNFLSLLSATFLGAGMMYFAPSLDVDGYTMTGI
jgi:hypothetical protein